MKRIRSRVSPESAPWSIPDEQLLELLGTGASGLATVDAERRLAASPRHRSHPLTGPLRLLARQIASPIVLMLIGAAGLSYFLQDPTDAQIIAAIVLASGGLGFLQEWRAGSAVEKLLDRVRSRTTVLRDGRPRELPVEEVVPGDVVLLAAGSTVPADCRLLEARGCQVVEAALTGESFPVEKTPGLAAPDAALATRGNWLFFGTHVASGTARAVVVHTGAETEFGAIAQRLRLRPPETEFERGVRRFGNLLAEVTFLLVLGIFAVNVHLGRPSFDSLLFALALAVGLTPQLLPAVIAVNLAHGARRMATNKVIVKRLAAIESLGSMDVLCCDKTGTLTKGEVRVEGSLNPAGGPGERALFFAGLNAAFESGFDNPIDRAIRSQAKLDLADASKLDEVPYDFVRKRLSVLLAREGSHWLVTKGAVPQVLAACGDVEVAGEEQQPVAAMQPQLEAVFADLSRHGLRCLGVAIRDLGTAVRASPEDESEMTFVGFLTLADPLKTDAAATVEELRRLGVSLRVLTGDNRLVVEALAPRLGLDPTRILTGPELRQMSDDALRVRVDQVEVFAEIEPNQKERILLALKRGGHVVGFLGDGINDATALHTADVGLSVEGAVDVAREAADLVLLEPGLAVVAAGVREGRATFANTLKYAFMATSANFGNMFSMAGASLLLPFLPLLPKQILLTNLLTDLPEMAIAGDRVDATWIERPHRWNIRFIRSFMLVFGALSSLFDFATFAVLWFGLRAATAEFRTGWFVESVVSAALIVLLIRTRGPALASRPSRALAAATAGVVLAAALLPWTPLGAPFGFTRLPPVFYAAVAAIVVGYVVSTELAKRVFYRWTAP